MTGRRGQGNCTSRCRRFAHGGTVRRSMSRDVWRLDLIRNSYGGFGFFPGRAEGHRTCIFSIRTRRTLSQAGGGKGKVAEDLENDVEIIAAALARDEDILLVRHKPTLTEVERLREWGLVLPDCEEIGPDGTLPDGSLTAERKLHQLRPWGWCRESVKLMRDLGEDCERQEVLARKLNAKTWAADLAEGTVCRTLEEVRACGEGTVVKAPLGVSGQRNRMWSEENASWVERMLRSQKEVVVERWHRKATV